MGRMGPGRQKSVSQGLKMAATRKYKRLTTVFYDTLQCLRLESGING